MPQRQLDHFSDCCHLLPAATNVVVANVVQLLLFFSVDGFSFSVEYGAGRHYAVLFGLSSYYLELHRLETSSHVEEVSLFDWSVGVFEVGDEVGFSEITGNALNGVSEWENVDFGEVGHISCRFDLDNVSQTDPQVFSDGFVQSYFAVIQLVINEGHHQGLFSLLPLDEYGVALENLQLCHLGLAQLDRGIFIVYGLFHLGTCRGTSSLLGAFFWSSMAVETSFFGSIN